MRLEDGSWLALDRWLSDYSGRADQSSVPGPVQHRWLSLGAIAEAAGAIEVCLQQIFVALMDSRRASILASGQSVIWLVDNCLAILQKQDFPHTEDSRQLIEVLKRAPAVLNSRNHLLHAFWVKHEGRDARVNTRYRKAPTLNPVEATELSATANRLHVLEYLLADLGYRIFGDKMTWHSVIVGRPEPVALTVDDLDRDLPFSFTATTLSRLEDTSELIRRAAQLLKLIQEKDSQSPRLLAPPGRGDGVEVIVIL